MESARTQGGTDGGNGSKQLTQWLRVEGRLWQTSCQSPCTVKEPDCGLTRSIHLARHG